MEVRKYFVPQVTRARPTVQTRRSGLSRPLAPLPENAVSAPTIFRPSAKRCANSRCFHVTLTNVVNGAQRLGHCARYEPVETIIAITSRPFKVILGKVDKIIADGWKRRNFAHHIIINRGWDSDRDVVRFEKLLATYRGRRKDWHTLGGVLESQIESRFALFSKRQNCDSFSPLRSATFAAGLTSALLIFIFMPTRPKST